MNTGAGSGHEPHTAPAWQIVGDAEADGVLVLADHASNHVPADIDLGLPPDQRDALMRSHIAHDIGVGAIASRMAERHGYSAILGAVSRLVCDLNRSTDDPAVIPLNSDGVALPGNHDIDRKARLDRFYFPFHTQLEHMLSAQPPRVTLILHSFTPMLASAPEQKRPWHCGLLYDETYPGEATPAQCAMEWLAEDGLIVGDQLPYSGKVYNTMMRQHFTGPERPYLYIELRQDLISDEAGQAQWAKRLTKLCDAVVGELPAAAR